ncbi:hypothetical protein [Desulfonatronum sp. SC1]|uniref:hypothetical protein n=1 Tax=Desulfonatronum sp. SC1 TaxID=2109626 RepID=UPI000D2FBC78|nr:hypothetical protein [Desulfonatronum sp. SC1]PTN37534.1 hypothetical protein C6366_06125 [Desulfonatronum sp. SC1]
MMKKNLGIMTLFTKKISRMFFLRKKNESDGGVILGLIFGFVVFGGLIAAVYTMTSSSMMQTVSTNNSLNAYYMAESGFRIASGYYLNTGDVSNSGMIDDDKAEILESYLNGMTFTIGDKGSVTLDVYPYWLMSTGGNSAKFPGKVPPGFTLPAAGKLLCVGGEFDDRVYIDYTGGSFSGGVFTYTSSVSCDDRFSMYVTLNPLSSQSFSHGESLTMALNTFPPEAVMRHNGMIQVGEDESNLFTYERAVEGNSITLEGIRRISDPKNEDGWTETVDTSHNIIFKRALILESRGQSGAEERMLRFFTPIQDSKPIPGSIEFVPETTEQLEEMFEGDGMSLYSVRSLLSAGGGSDLYAIIERISDVTSGSSSGQNDFKHATFWFKDRHLVDHYWRLGGGRLSYDVQAKPSTGNRLLNGALGLSFRAYHTNPESNFPDHYYGVSFMRYSMDTLYFQHGNLDIEPGDTIEAWTCANPSSGANNTTCNIWGVKRGSAIVQGMPYLTSGSFSSGNARGSIRLTNITHHTGSSAFWGHSSTPAWLRTPDGDFIARALNRSDAFVPAVDNDWIPDKIKPKPTDFASGHPFHDDRYSIGDLLIVLWERRGNIWQWLAFKDISYDVYTRGMQDWNQSGAPPYGSCTSNCQGYDGPIVNDKASLLLKVREKRTVIGGTPEKYNEVNVFYGDASSRWVTRTPNNIPYDVMGNRQRYLPKSYSGSPYPFWPPERMAFWTMATDYLSHIQRVPGAPNDGPHPYQWDSEKPGVSQLVFDILNDGSVQTSSISSFDPALSPTYRQHEVGMHGFGDIWNTSGDYRVVGFADFALKFVFEDAKLYGGFLEAFVQ